MVVELGNYTVNVIITRKNNKNLYIRVKEDLNLYVTCNKFTTEHEILKIIKNNEKSLIKMYEKQLGAKEHNSYYYYLGEKCTVIFDESIKKPSKEDDLIYVKDEKMLDKFYKDACIKVFSDRVEKNKLLFDGIPEFKLRIRKMTTRWGVCNRTSKIVTLNSELIKKDITLLDYVIIHELSHFYEGNHSKRFWNEVGKRYPYYKEVRKQLNEY